MTESNTEELKKALYSTIGELSVESSESKHINALFRHASANSPGDDPLLWGWIINHTPEKLQGRCGDISPGEYALYLTLAMKAIGPKEDVSKTIAQAVSDAQIKRQKIASVETASDIDRLQIELRSLVKLLGSKGIGFNYGKLMADIYNWQFDNKKIWVARKWEREYAQKEISNEQ